MSEPDLENLKRLLDEIDFDHPDIEAVATAVLSRDPGYAPAVNALGRTLLDRGELEEAFEVYKAGLEADPTNSVADQRMRAIRRQLISNKVLRADQESRPRRSPAEIVDPVLMGPSRDACLAFLAWSIRAIERIDVTRLAVTDIPSENRFRVVGGVYSAVAPWHGLLCVSVDKHTDPNVTGLVEAAGGSVTDAPSPNSAVPRTIQVGIPFAQVETLADSLRRPHVEHLKHSIAWGLPTWLRRHDPALRAYILEQAGD